MALNFFAQTFGRDRGAYVRSVFNALETPRSALFAEKLESRSQSLVIIYTVTCVLWSVIVSAAGVDAIMRDAPVPQLLHVSVISLVFGICLFPLRMILVPFGVFLLSYFAGLTTVALITVAQPYGWQLSLVALIVNLFVGSLAGLAGKGVYTALNQRGLSAPAEVWAAGALCVVLTLVGYFATSAMIESMLQFAHSKSPALSKFEIFQRAFRLSLVSAGLYLLFLDFPARRHLREAILFSPIFIAKGVLTSQGFYLYGALDPTLIGIVLLLVRPIYPAMASVVFGFVLYIAITGQFVLQPAMLTPQDVRLEITSSLAMWLMLLITIARVRGHSLVKRQFETLGRLSRAQELSQVGYFVVDIDQRLAQLDDVAQQILGSDPELRTSALVRRTHPDDRALLAGTALATAPSQSITLRLNRAGDWTADCTTSTISVFLRYEKLWDGRLVCYGVVVDVTQEHMQENHLREVLAELSDRQSRQTQLFSIISHELRSPASMLAMIIEEMDDGGDWKVMGPQMRAVTDQMMSVLADMRQTVRPEQNLPIYMEPMRPQLVAESVRNTFHILAKNKGITIDLRMSVEAMQERVTDRVRLIQALSNIVKNAIVHSRATIITIAYREEQDDNGPIGHWRIWDNGRNLPERVRGRLFEAFARDDTATTRSDGSGLGLFIARTTMQLLGGDIVYIHRPNSGATFEITLPMTLPLAAIEEPAKAVPVKPKERLDVSKMSVLLVEDSHMMGSLMAARLEKSFGKVEWVGGGLHAVEAVARNQPDVILTDLFMPGLGGDELARSLRLQGNKVPIIGMTAADVGDEINRFRTCGADEVLTKPVRMDQLLDALEKVIVRDTVAKLDVAAK